MVGHEQVIFARSRGLTVTAVFLDDGPAPKWDAETELMEGGMPVVYLEGADVRTVDLAFLRGLPVHLSPGAANFDRWSTLYHRLTELPVARLASVFEGEVYAWQPQT